MKPTTCKQRFKGCENLTTIVGIENLNTSEVTDITTAKEGNYVVKPEEASTSFARTFTSGNICQSTWEDEPTEDDAWFEPATIEETNKSFKGVLD
ncbi:MAG: hypothetical protein J6B91_01020 [Prevotella sp.]|nr:hypothetical protein [Prevotella sp.]